MLRFLRSPWRLAAVAVVLLAVVAAALYLTPAQDTYIVLPDRAHALGPRIDVEGRPPPDDEQGGIYFVDVVIRRATLLEQLVPSMHEGAALVPAHRINPIGVPERQRRRASLREMTRSQRIAAAVALREAGYYVAVEEEGALVTHVLPDAPSVGKLEGGDVIVAVEGRRVRTPDALRRALAAHGPGDRLSLRVRRDERDATVAVRAGRNPRERNAAFLGVVIEPAVEIDLPVEVEIDVGRVGGPSAGLAFALALFDVVGREVDGGAKVAVTGALELDGDVQPVGGVPQKVIGARRTGVDVFVVPARNLDEARAEADGLRVIPVDTFDEALQALATVSAGGQDS